jgi:hypothetical protein
MKKSFILGILIVLFVDLSAQEGPNQELPEAILA